MRQKLSRIGLVEACILVTGKTFVFYVLLLFSFCRGVFVLCCYSRCIVLVADVVEPLFPSIPLYDVSLRGEDGFCKSSCTTNDHNIY